MSRDSETIRQLCVSLEAMTNERDQALIRAERAEHAHSSADAVLEEVVGTAKDDRDEIVRLLKEVRDLTSQRNELWEALKLVRAALEQERALRVAADEALGRLTAAHEAVTTDWGALRDGLATLIDETFGLKTESTLDGMLTALKEGIRRLSTEANAVEAENLRLKEAVIVPPEGPGCRVEAYIDECAGAPAVALYPKDRSNGRWTTLDRFLDAVSEEFPGELIAAADRLRAVPVRGLQPDSPAALAAVLNAIATTHPEKLLAEFVEAYPERIIAAADKLRATAQLDASGEIDRHRPETTEIVGEWFAGAIRTPNGKWCAVKNDELVFGYDQYLGNAPVSAEHPITNVLAVLSLMKPALVLAAADKLRSAPVLPEIVGEWKDGAIVSTGGTSCRVVSEDSNRWVEFGGRGHPFWEPTPNVIAILARAGLLPTVPIDKETLAKLALLDWTRDHDSRYACLLKNGGIQVRDWFMESSEITAVSLCEKLGIEVES